MADNFARLKYRWLDRIMHDTGLSAADRLVAYEIACHINRRDGTAWPSQATIARKLGIDLKSVKRGVAALQGKPKKPGARQGTTYIMVSFDETSRSNTYIPCFEAAALSPTDRDFVPPHGGIMSPSDGGNLSVDGDITPRSDRDKNGPLSSLSNNPLEQTRSVAPISVTSPGDRHWLAVKNRLAIRLSPAVVRSWFSNVEVVAITSNEVVLACPSRFARSHIESNHLGDRLSEAWRIEVPSIERVRLVDPPIARAAE